MLLTPGYLYLQVGIRVILTLANYHPSLGSIKWRACLYTLTADNCCSPARILRHLFSE
jgi:hypothetical protein